MTVEETPNSLGIIHDGDLCGREMDGGTVCGKPAVIWTYLEGRDWHGYATTACADHRDELLAYPGVLVSSDARLQYDEDPR